MEKHKQFVVTNDSGFLIYSYNHSSKKYHLTQTIEGNSKDILIPINNVFILSNSYTQQIYFYDKGKKNYQKYGDATHCLWTKYVSLSGITYIMGKNFEDIKNNIWRLQDIQGKDIISFVGKEYIIVDFSSYILIDRKHLYIVDIENRLMKFIRTFSKEYKQGAFLGKYLVMYVSGTVDFIPLDSKGKFREYTVFDVRGCRILDEISVSIKTNSGEIRIYNLRDTTWELTRVFKDGEYHIGNLCIYKTYSPPLETPNAEKKLSEYKEMRKEKVWRWAGSNKGFELCYDGESGFHTRLLSHNTYLYIKGNIIKLVDLKSSSRYLEYPSLNEVSIFQTIRVDDKSKLYTINASPEESKQLIDIMGEYIQVSKDLLGVLVEYL